MAEKLYYTMGEIAEMFDVNLSLIRYWESKFDILKPKKNKKGNRLFRPEDVENFRVIYHLVKECGMTLEGAQRALQKRGRSGVSRSAELMERLQALRSMLVELREMLGEEDSDSGFGEGSEADEAAAAVSEESSEEVSAGVTVLEPGRMQLLEEERKSESEERKSSELPFYEQTLF